MRVYRSLLANVARKTRVHRKVDERRRKGRRWETKGDRREDEEPVNVKES